jgi:hypothetical protein
VGAKARHIAMLGRRMMPLFTDAANRAFDAVDKYGAPNCPAAG